MIQAFPILTRYRPTPRWVRNGCAPGKYHQRHRGLTLVELLVVIGIVGLLAAILIPAVQSVREAARRTQCQNNLHQIALALQMHVNVKQRLPAGWLADNSGRPGWSWAATLLPHLEEKTLAEQFKLTQPADSFAFAAVRETVVPVFLCPSDDAPEKVSITAWSATLRGMATYSATSVVRSQTRAAVSTVTPFDVARSNYVAVYGSLAISPPFAGNGTFFRNSQIRLQHITDGLSKTFVVGERSSRLASSTWVGVFSSVESLPESVVGVTEHAPNDALANFGDFGSPHAFVSNFAMADGSVRSINDEIDVQIFRALSTRSGGELVHDENGTFGGGSPITSDGGHDDGPGDDSPSTPDSPPPADPTNPPASPPITEPGNPTPPPDADPDEPDDPPMDPAHPPDDGPGDDHGPGGSSSPGDDGSGDHPDDGNPGNQGPGGDNPGDDDTDGDHSGGDGPDHPDGPDDDHDSDDDNHGPLLP